MKIPPSTVDAFKQRFPRGVPARLLRVIRAAAESYSAHRTERESRNEDGPVLCFCVEQALGPDQEVFLRRLAESGFKIPWSKVVLSSPPAGGSDLPTILFGCQKNQVIENGILQTYPIDQLMNDVTKKRIFWELAKVTFRGIITS